MDIIIKNGCVVDGTGNTWFKADVGIEDEKIAKIGILHSASAERVIDATGLVVSPGFVDVHTHSDFTLLVNPRAESYIRQGVTTEVVGNCGMSGAPVPKDEEGLLGFKQRLVPGVELDWNTLGEYLDKIEKQGIAQNVASLIGHSTVRLAVMGYDSRLATKDEIEKMKNHINQSMRDGAFGMSTGLEYTPGMNADTDELVELTKIVSKHSGIYVTHIRNRDEKFIEIGIKEAIEIGERAGVPVQISHIWPEWPYAYLGKEARRMVREARERGLDVNYDAHIWGWANGSLMALLPPWAYEGGVEKTLERLGDPETREKMKKDPRFWPLARFGRWDMIWVSNCAKSPELIGKNIAEIAKLRGKEDGWDIVYDMLLEELPLGSTVGLHGDSNVDILGCCLAPECALETDGIASAPYGILKEHSERSHPRSFGTYPRVFREYVKGYGALGKLLTLEEAVRKCSSLPARQFRLFDRGLLRKGQCADIVIFDLDEITEKGTFFTNANAYPEGIEYVILNGQVVIERGEHTGTLSGKVLRGYDYLK